MEFVDSLYFMGFFLALFIIRLIRKEFFPSEKEIWEDFDSKNQETRRILSLKTHLINHAKLKGDIELFKIIKDDELNKLRYKQLLKIAKKKNIEL